MQAADLIARIALVMKTCGEDQLMGHLGIVLYEYLGEEYPEVLGSILGALKAIVNVIGMEIFLYDLFVVTFKFDYLKLFSFLFS
jgi:hypothetical protein